MRAGSSGVYEIWNTLRFRKAKEEPQRFVDIVRCRKCLAQLGSDFNERKGLKKVRILAMDARGSGPPFQNIRKVDRL